MNQKSLIRIGIDFDNTIICYNSAFYNAAIKKKLIPLDIPANKNQIRNFLRQNGQENDWIQLQGDVYGECILDATLFPGFIDFVNFCENLNISLFIVSHKTIHPYSGGKANLHDAAKRWMVHKGFFDKTKISIEPSNVYFELTKADKIERIKALRCSYFIDDLPEFLLENAFPNTTQRILFDPSNQHLTTENSIKKMTSWENIRIFFSEQLNFI